MNLTKELKQWEDLQSDIRSGVHEGTWSNRAITLFVGLSRHPISGDSAVSEQLIKIRSDMDAWPNSLSIVVWQQMYDSLNMCNRVMHNHLTHIIMPRIWSARTSDPSAWSDVKNSLGMTQNALRILAYDEHNAALLNAWAGTSHGLPMVPLIKLWECVAKSMPPTPQSHPVINAMWAKVAGHPDASPEMCSIALLHATTRGHVRWAATVAPSLKLPKHHDMWAKWYESAVIYGGAKLVDICLKNMDIKEKTHPIKTMMEQALSTRFDDVSEAIWKHIPTNLDMAKFTDVMRNIGPKGMRTMLDHINPSSDHTAALVAVVRYSGRGRIGDIVYHHDKTLQLAARCTPAQIKKAVLMTANDSYGDEGMSSSLRLLVPFMTPDDVAYITKTNRLLFSDPAWMAAVNHAELSRHVTTPTPPSAHRRM